MSTEQVAARAAAQKGGATRVALGILASRLLGLVRQRVFAHFFGNSVAADAFAVAFRIPNLLQNLLGEGVLSASFVPVYARLLAEDAEERAREVAGAVLAILALVVAVLVLVGVLGAPQIVAVLAPGFTGESRALAIQLVRLLFPGAGLFVLSAWALGVLNSHRHFFLAYVAPVAWNVAQIVALIYWGGRQPQEALVVTVAWASVVGALLQVLVQLPEVFKLAGRIRPVWRRANPDVREIVRNFLPVVTGRGVVQFSAYFDTWIASQVSAVVQGAVSALTYSQLIYMLPISLFGASISAAELPAMSSELGAEDEVASKLRARLDSAVRRVAFLVIPSAVAFVVLGDFLVGAVYQGGLFARADTEWVWGILAGSSVGLLATVFGRLYSSAFYALRDTRTPMRFAIVRVSLSVLLAAAFALKGPGLLGIDARWGVAGLTLGSGLGGWIEYLLLRTALRRRIGDVGTSRRFLATLWAMAVAASIVASTTRLATGVIPPLVLSLAGLLVYSVAYLALARAVGVPEVSAVLARLPRRRR